MAIDVQKSLISAGVGVADEVTAYMDTHSQTPRSGSFKTMNDWGRLVIAGLGYGLQSFSPRNANLGETLAIAATPLLVKSLAVPLKKAMKITADVSDYVRTPPMLVGSAKVYASPVESRYKIG